MNHSFDVDHARLYGIEEAILISNFHYWIAHNAANGKHHYDGRIWTYNSVQAFAELFPYMTYAKVRRALENLIKAGVLIDGNHNERAADRTKWYAFSDSFICQNPQMHLSKNTNGSAKTRKSTNTSNINTDSKPDSKHTPDAAKPLDGYPPEFDECWQAYPPKPGANKKAAFEKWQARIREGADAVELLNGVLAYANYVRHNRTEPQYIKAAETFFGPKLHFRSSWTVSGPPKNETITERNARIKAESRASRGQPPHDDDNTIDMRP